MRWIPKTGAVFALLLVVAGCGGDTGYTQAEVDDLVQQAVADAVAEQEDRISEEEAQKQIQEGLAQASLAAAEEACLETSSIFVTVDEGGLVMEGEGDESPGVDYQTILCVLDELDVPQSVLTRIANTNSTMGLVEGAWGDYSATWSYHPDNGMFIHIVADE